MLFVLLIKAVKNYSKKMAYLTKNQAYFKYKDTNTALKIKIVLPSGKLTLTPGSRQINFFKVAVRPSWFLCWPIFFRKPKTHLTNYEFIESLPNEFIFKFHQHLKNEYLNVNMTLPHTVFDSINIEGLNNEILLKDLSVDNKGINFNHVTNNQNHEIQNNALKINSISIASNNCGVKIDNLIFQNSLRINTHSGAARLAGVRAPNGFIDLNINNGSIQSENTQANELNYQLTNGSIRINRHEGLKATLHLINGSIFKGILTCPEIHIKNYNGTITEL